MTSDADDQPRLSKRMGELGLCSRREAEAWIVAGWVKVDGQVVDVLGTRVNRAARIEVDPRARAQQATAPPSSSHQRGP
jgi:23S rRNA pseudouridine2604 synthase